MCLLPEINNILFLRYLGMSNLSQGLRRFEAEKRFNLTPRMQTFGISNESVGRSQSTPAPPAELLQYLLPIPQKQPQVLLSFLASSSGVGKCPQSKSGPKCSPTPLGVSFLPDPGPITLHYLDSLLMSPNRSFKYFYQLFQLSYI